MKKNWEDVDFTVLKTNQQLLRLDDGSRTLTRMDVIHTNVIPNATYLQRLSHLVGARWPGAP